MHSNTMPVHVAGRYGYLQVTPTADETARGYESAWMVVDFATLEGDGFPTFTSDTPVSSRAAAIAAARELHRYQVEGGEALHRAAIGEWAAELAGVRA
jgi:hypothetical protein